MGKIEKLIEKFLNPGSTITFQELEYFLSKNDYKEKKTGKTSGSRKAYINYKSKHIIRLHKPHPGNNLKKYVKNYLIKEFKKEGLI